MLFRSIRPFDLTPRRRICVFSVEADCLGWGVSFLNLTSAKLDVSLVQSIFPLFVYLYLCSRVLSCGFSPSAPHPRLGFSSLTLILFVTGKCNSRFANSKISCMTCSVWGESCTITRIGYRNRNYHPPQAVFSSEPPYPITPRATQLEIVHLYLLFLTGGENEPHGSRRVLRSLSEHNSSSLDAIRFSRV